MLRLFSTIATAPFLRGSALVLVLAANTAAGESPDGLWIDIGAAQRPAAQEVGPRSFRTFALREDRLEELLSGAPMEFTAAQAVSMTLPAPDGTYVRVSVENSPIFSPELQAAYAGIRTYRAAGRDDRTASGRFDVGPAGFHAMLISEAGTVLVEPARDGDPSHYISYWKRDVEGKPFACSLPGASEAEHLETLPLRMTHPSGDQLRSYRLAISATGEYTAHFGSVAAAVAQIATTVNRVAAVYEREVAISFVLVATNVYPDAATDPFTAQNLGLMLGENQTALDVNVGSANYDIGHVFGALDLGGVAFLGVVCTPGAKARGVSSLRDPSGYAFDVDLVPHEIGHQFDAGHTFHGISGVCQANRNPATAYEPGSGSTIMSYAGSCDPETVQYVADDYFHTASFDQITRFDGHAVHADRFGRRRQWGLAHLRVGAVRPESPVANAPARPPVPVAQADRDCVADVSAVQRARGTLLSVGHPAPRRARAEFSGDGSGQPRRRRRRGLRLDAGERGGRPVRDRVARIERCAGVRSPGSGHLGRGRRLGFARRPNLLLALRRGLVRDAPREHAQRRIRVGDAPAGAFRLREHPARPFHRLLLCRLPDPRDSALRDPGIRGDGHDAP
jgi:hypothetical protein